MSEKKTQPMIHVKKENRCPVCGEVSYSRGGVHPQCSVKQADQKRANRIKLDRQSGKTAKPISAVKSWQRVCPKCKAVQHVRKKVCECGQTLALQSRTPSDEVE